jgi:hypothetical protein
MYVHICTQVHIPSIASPNPSATSVSEVKEVSKSLLLQMKHTCKHTLYQSAVYMKGKGEEGEGVIMGRS